MTATEAVERAAAALERAEEVASVSPATATALATVADSWSRLAVAITQHKIG